MRQAWCTIFIDRFELDFPVGAGMGFICDKRELVQDIYDRTLAIRKFKTAFPSLQTRGNFKVYFLRTRF